MSKNNTEEWNVKSTQIVWIMFRDNPRDEKSLAEAKREQKQKQNLNMNKKAQSKKHQSSWTEHGQALP